MYRCNRISKIQNLKANHNQFCADGGASAVVVLCLGGRDVDIVLPQVYIPELYAAYLLWSDQRGIDQLAHCQELRIVLLQIVSNFCPGRWRDDYSYFVSLLLFTQGGKRILLHITLLHAPVEKAAPLLQIIVPAA